MYLLNLWACISQKTMHQIIINATISSVTILIRNSNIKFHYSPQFFQIIGVVRRWFFPPAENAFDFIHIFQFEMLEVKVLVQHPLLFHHKSTREYPRFNIQLPANNTPYSILHTPYSILRIQAEAVTRYLLDELVDFFHQIRMSLLSQEGIAKDLRKCLGSGFMSLDVDC